MRVFSSSSSSSASSAYHLFFCFIVLVRSSLFQCFPKKMCLILERGLPHSGDHWQRRSGPEGFVGIATASLCCRIGGRQSQPRCLCQSWPVWWLGKLGSVEDLGDNGPGVEAVQVKSRDWWDFREDQAQTQCADCVECLLESLHARSSRGKDCKAQGCRKEREGGSEASQDCARQERSTGQSWFD